MSEIQALTVVLDYDLINAIYYAVMFALGVIAGLAVGKALSWWKW